MTLRPRAVRQHVSGTQKESKREREAAELKKQQERHAILVQIEQIKAQHADLKARQDAERNKLDDLLNQAESWRHSQNLRAYLQALHEKVNNGIQTLLPPAEFENWMRWAHEQADRLDPLSPTPKSVLDEPLPQIPEPPRAW